MAVGGFAVDVKMAVKSLTAFRKQAAEPEFGSCSESDQISPFFVSLEQLRLLGGVLGGQAGAAGGV